MNVNGSGFKLLLGRADWARSLAHDDAVDTLDAAWAVPADPAAPPAGLPAWDAARQELTLAPRAIELPPGSALLSPDARRSAAADRHGNVYRIADDRLSLQVLSAGSGDESPFWPSGAGDCAAEHGAAESAFGPVDAPDTRAVDRFLALTVTCDDALVAACARGAGRGFLCFDLVAGGPPVETAWPAGVPFDPFDLCPRHGGGLWALDRVQQRLWEFDATLSVVDTGQAMLPLAPAVVDDFQPLQGPQRAQPARTFPSGLALGALAPALVDAVSIEALGPRSLLLLDRDASQVRSRVVRLRRDGQAWQVDASPWLDALPALAQDMAWASAPRLREAALPRLFVGTAIGNQAHAFALVDDDTTFALEPSPELYPLRRWGGRALIRAVGQARYDCGDAPLQWVQVVQQPLQRFETQASLVTPVFDSNDVGTVWDRLAIDACLPAGTTLVIESRAADECTIAPSSPASPALPAQVLASWQFEPPLVLASAGIELPWLRDEAARRTQRASGIGTWELLLQKATGRYLQLRLTLRSDNGTGTPRVRALRAWFPRFSYSRRFLPAVYSEDPTGGAFLERWLALFESTLTRLEDRIAALQCLFDARTVPGDALPWLAQWFDLALDPGWDERRHRLLVRRAMDFFRWRGTVHGLRLALALAFDPCIDEAMFDDPSAQPDDARSIRIVEAYQTRLVQAWTADAATLAAAAADGPRILAQQAAWTPAEGNAGLVDRLAALQGREATALERLTPFPLVPPTDPAALAQWTTVCVQALGVVPAAGAAERARWQAFLQARYGDVATLNAAHSTNVAKFADIALPDDQPTDAQQAADWVRFCASPDGLAERTLWADFLARRYRRIARLRATQRVSWTAFELVALPDRLPASIDGQTDWLQYERQLLPMHLTAHRFSVLLPVDNVQSDPYMLQTRLALARRIVELEKPAHTVFDVRFYWAFNRVGVARLGLDTQLGAGSRASELIPDAVVGRAYLGASFVGGPPRLQGRDRLTMAC